MSEHAEIEYAEKFIQWAVSHFNGPVTPIKVRSGAHSTVYELRSADQNWYLKMGEGLKPEQERMSWLRSKQVAVPEVVDFKIEGEQEALLTTAIEGIDLARLSTKWSSDKVISSLASALRTFHAIEISDCPFTAYRAGNVLVHGYACLPNFIFKEDGSFSGYIDLLDMGVGSIEVDLSAAVWSLHLNLGPGYGLEFLKQYGLKDANENEVERLRLMYEQGPIFKR